MYVGGGEKHLHARWRRSAIAWKAGLAAIGGIVHHLRALTAIGSSTVNSYRRLWDTGFWAPVFADWGFQNRTTGCACRRQAVSSIGRWIRWLTRI